MYKMTGNANFDAQFILSLSRPALPNLVRQKSKATMLQLNQALHMKTLQSVSLKRSFLEKRESP
jgi:hypothetical protein